MRPSTSRSSCSGSFGGEELPDVFRRGVNGAAVVVELVEPEVDEEVPDSGDEDELD
jgi:hypothetical protein